MSSSGGDRLGERCSGRGDEGLGMSKRVHKKLTTRNGESTHEMHVGKGNDERAWMVELGAAMRGRAGCNHKDKSMVARWGRHRWSGCAQA
jgi:hypothetical protein